mmetsp:Transcript_106968/g.149077  ORF Transcript_106968/g.149077 Transcript_106968/m.149077 type:complete len:204 (-) Transcript_106968:57-668(-)
MSIQALRRQQLLCHVRLQQHLQTLGVAPLRCQVQGCPSGEVQGAHELWGLASGHHEGTAALCVTIVGRIMQCGPSVLEGFSRDDFKRHLTCHSADPKQLVQAAVVSFSCCTVNCRLAGVVLQRHEARGDLKELHEAVGPAQYCGIMECGLTALPTIRWVGSLLYQHIKLGFPIFLDSSEQGLALLDSDIAFWQHIHHDSGTNS